MNQKMRKKKAMTRRDFLLQTSALATSSVALSGCSGIDSYFQSDRRIFENEVFIIGAGAAGLMAAHTLKKNRIPFRLFEATHRPGGRLLSIQAMDQMTVEMGAEFFEPQHKIIFETLKEFQMEWEEVVDNPINRNLWQSSVGEVLSETEYQQISSRFLNRMISDRLKVFGSADGYQVFSPALAAELDSLSFQEYLQTHWIDADPRVLKYWDSWTRTQHSVDSRSLSALQVLWQTRADQKVKSLFRVQGGWSELVRRLYDRVAGVIPDHLVKMKWTLHSISRNHQGFRCQFKTPNGLESFTSSHVILALPMNQYSKINGFKDLDISQTKKNRIQSAALGESSKVFVSLGTQPTEALSKMNYWLQDQTLITLKKSDQSYWLGGLRGGSGSQWTLPDIENWKAGLLERSPADVSAKNKFLDYHVVNWKDQPFIQGARSLWEPGSWLSNSTLFESPDFGGKLQWAGEFVPAFEKGSVNSAFESGRIAALNMIENLKSRA
jgi:monoamine oxidase